MTNQCPCEPCTCLACDCGPTCQCGPACKCGEACDCAAPDASA